MNIRRAVTNMIWPAILACLLMSAAVPPGVPASPWCPVDRAERPKRWQTPSCVPFPNHLTWRI
jgi:hypothetical protein